jgi:hypothetical protein
MNVKDAEFQRGEIYSNFLWLIQKATQKTESRNNKNAKVINLEMTLDIYRLEFKKNHKSHNPSNNDVKFKKLKYHKFYNHFV